MKATVILTDRFSKPTMFRFPLEERLDLANPLNDTDYILDYIFRQCNRVNGKEWISTSKLKVRSLSVGDFVILDNDMYICASTGWEKFVHPPLDN